MLDKIATIILLFFPHYTDICYVCIVPGRVRVAVRLRPRNAEEMAADADFADCVELQPEVLSICLINCL